MLGAGSSREAGRSRPEEEADGTRAAIRVGEHTDFGAFTFLLLGKGAVGLQITPVAGAEVGGAGTPPMATPPPPPPGMSQVVSPVALFV